MGLVTNLNHDATSFLKDRKLHDFDIHLHNNANKNVLKLILWSPGLSQKFTSDKLNLDIELINNLVVLGYDANEHFRYLIFGKWFTIEEIELWNIGIRHVIEIEFIDSTSKKMFKTISKDLFMIQVNQMCQSFRRHHSMTIDEYNGLCNDYIINDEKTAKPPEE